jgi:hypothetical protein
MSSSPPKLVRLSPKPAHERRCRPRTEDAETEAAIRHYLELAAAAVESRQARGALSDFWPKKPKAS